MNDLRNSKWVAIARLIFVILMLSACGGGGGDGSDPVDLPPPVNVYSYSEPVEKTDGWTTADAGALGMSVGLLEDMMNTLDTDFDIADSIAIEQGVFSGVDQSYLDLFPYPSYQNWDERKSDILLEDVLTMRLGLQWNEWDPPSPIALLLWFQSARQSRTTIH